MRTEMTIEEIRRRLANGPSTIPDRILFPNLIPRHILRDPEAVAAIESMCMNKKLFQSPKKAKFLNKKGTANYGTRGYVPAPYQPTAAQVMGHQPIDPIMPVLRSFQGEVHGMIEVNE